VICFRDGTSTLGLDPGSGTVICGTTSGKLSITDVD
jgi:hypothetical protein